MLTCRAIPMGTEERERGAEGEARSEGRPGGASSGGLDGLRNRLRRPGTLLALQVVVAAGLVGALLVFVDLPTLRRTLVAIEPWAILGAMACLVATLLVGAFDVWVLLRAIAPLPYRTALRVYVIAWSSFLALPGSAGDAVQILLFKRADVEYREGTSVYLTDKLVTLGVNLAVVALGGGLLLPGRVRPWVLFAAVAALAVLAVGSYLAARRWLAAKLRMVGRLVAVVDYAVAYARRHPSRIALNLAGTLLRTAAAAASAWILFRGLGTEIAATTVLVLHFTAGLVAYVPIAFNGVGTVEATAVGLYGLFGVAAADTLAMYLVLRGLIVLTAGAGLAAATVGRRG